MLQAAAWCAVNGLGLAMVIPCIQSILAEVWVAKYRGRAFGSLFTISALGGIGMKYAAIVLGTEEVGRLDVSSSFSIMCCCHLCEGLVKLQHG